MSGEKRKGIEWFANMTIAMAVATVVAGGFWIVTGKPAGGPMWCLWVLTSMVTSTAIDLHRAFSSGNQL